MAFETIITNTEDQLIITLKDLTNDTFAEIYAFGPLLNKFSVQENGEALNVVQGFSNPGEATYKADPFFKSAKLSPYACRVKNASYKFGEKEYKLKKYLSQPDAVHGFLYNAVFAVKSHNSDSNSASVSLEYRYSEDDEGY